jgi:hypothetical protein
MSGHTGARYDMHTRSIKHAEKHRACSREQKAPQQRLPIANSVALRF